MAGIAGSTAPVPNTVSEMLQAMAHRGTGKYGLIVRNDITLGQIGSTSPDSEPNRVEENRLGTTLLANEDETLHLVLDGDLFNAGQLRSVLMDRGHTFRTPLPAEIVIHLFEEEGPEAIKSLEGAFAFALRTTEGLLLARDPLGIKPLYIGHTADGDLMFASELRPLIGQVTTVMEFPPGHYWTEKTGFVRYFSLPPITEDADDPEQIAREIADALRSSIRRVLPANQPVGVLLSGGLDSSLVAALAAESAPTPLHSFAVGLAGSADLQQAEQVAAAIGTVHHQYTFTEDELIKALPEVVVRLESFDAALVRGAVANYFASRLASDHVQLVLSGEGADELFGGYHYLKDPKIRCCLQEELQEITQELHHTSLQRVDRMTAAHGIAAHLPFLSRRLLDLAWRIPADWKISPSGTEKWILRQAAQPVLPESIARRKKAKFATGSGVGPVLEAYADRIISDREYAWEVKEKASQGVTLASKEECLYFRFFSQAFGEDAALVARLIGRSRSLNEPQPN